MRKKCRFAILSALSFWTLAAADVGSGFNAGSGVRALAFANNHAAVVSDLSAVYWNPAALAVLPVREFQLSFDMLSVYSKSEVSGLFVTTPPGAKNYDDISRIRLSGAGAMLAIPTAQGGLTLAFSYDQPFVFDDVSKYTYSIGDDTRSLSGRRHGGLNRWNGAFGVQVTEQISAGLTVSIVTGKETTPIHEEEKSVSGELLDYYDAKYTNKYLGYTLTGGLLYYPVDILKIGLTINAAMDISVKETGVGKELNWYDTDDDGYIDAGYIEPGISTRDGRAYRAPGGTLGAAVTLPWATLALDTRVTMPYTYILPSEDIPEEVQARYFKLGAGVGFEVPLPNVPVVFRAGYSADEYDLFPIIHDFEYDRLDAVWDFGKPFKADGLKHTVSGGAGVFTSGLGFEASYCYQTWGIIQKGDSRALKQRYHNHRVAAALIYRY